MQAFMDWILSTPPSYMMNNVRWAWPIAETIHFIGLIVMAGTVAAFDLRLLGVAKGIPPAALHRLIRWGLTGFALSVVTGLLFISGAPDQYFYNNAFYFKSICLGLMGVNVTLFYSLGFKRILAMGPGDDAFPAAKVMAAASLALLVGVMLGGRMLTFFRPVTVY
jgi:formate-dependent nitrite reductase membrane component NrfD